MALFERDTRNHEEFPVDPRRDEAARSGSTSEAEDSAAHIAELVRRTTQRQASPRPTSTPRPESIAPPPAVPGSPPVRDTVPGAVPPAAPAADPGVARPGTSPIRRPTRRPSNLTLVVGSALVALLTLGGVALSHPSGSDAGSAAAPARPGNPAPAGYTVKVTDVVTNCAEHSRGRTKTVFESQHCVKATRTLATGRVSDRPALFVVSRIQMASTEAAASVKQVLDATGTGNLNDLLREGRTFPGAPPKMPSSGYASVQTGPVIMVAEAGFVGGGPSSNTIPALRAAAAQVAALGTTAK